MSWRVQRAARLSTIIWDSGTEFLKRAFALSHPFLRNNFSDPSSRAPVRTNASNTLIEDSASRAVVRNNTTLARPLPRNDSDPSAPRSPSDVISTSSIRSKTTMKASKKSTSRTFNWRKDTFANDDSLEIPIKTLTDALGIPPELSEMIVRSAPNDEPWRRQLEEAPALVLERIDYLVDEVGMTKAEIVEHLPLLVSKNSFKDYLPPVVFEKREKLHPFKSHAEFCANLYGVPLHTFYLAAAKEPKLLKLKEQNLEKADLLIKFGYPKDLILKRWSLLNTIAVKRLRKRIEMIEELEESGVGFVREYIYRTAHILKDNGDFLSIFLKLSGRWNETQLPPSVKNRVVAFARILNVNPEEVVKRADSEKFVGLAMFKDDYRLQEVVDIFSTVHVDGVAMLQNCRFFEHRPNDIREAIKLIQMVHPTDHFGRFHLDQLRSVLDRGQFTRRASIVPVGLKAKGLWSGDIGRTTKTRASYSYLKSIGFRDVDIVDCEKVCDFSEESLKRVVETRGDLFSSEKLQGVSIEERGKLINLLQYYAEKDDAGIEGTFYDGEEEEEEEEEDDDDDDDDDDDVDDKSDVRIAKGRGLKKVRDIATPRVADRQTST